MVIQRKSCCHICGNKGYKIALLYCSHCSNYAAHKYCLGIDPTGIEDESFICEFCNQSETERAIILVKEQPKPLCTLLPVEFEKRRTEGDMFVTEYPKEIMSGVVLMVSPTGEISVVDESSYYECFAKSILDNMVVVSETPVIRRSKRLRDAAMSRSSMRKRKRRIQLRCRTVDVY